MKRMKVLAGAIVTAVVIATGCFALVDTQTSTVDGEVVFTGIDPIYQGAAGQGIGQIYESVSGVPGLSMFIGPSISNSLPAAPAVFVCTVTVKVNGKFLDKRMPNKYCQTLQIGQTVKVKKRTTVLRGFGRVLSTNYD